MRGGHIIYQDIVAPAISVSQETVNMDKWHVQHHNPVLRKTLSTAILAGSIFFDPFPIEPQQEEVTLDKWFQPIQQPYFSKTRQVIPTGESRTEVIEQAPEEITLDKWYRPLSEPYFSKKGVNTGSTVLYELPTVPFDWQQPTQKRHITKRRDVPSGEYRFEVPRTILVSDWYQPMTQPYFSKKRNYFTGESRFEVPRTILISDWFQPTQQPRIIRRSAAGLFVFELPRVPFDYYRPIEQPRIIKRRNYFTGDTRTESAPSEDVTLDKYWRQLSEPVRRKVTRQTGGEYRFELPRVVLLSDWYQTINQPNIIRERQQPVISNIESIVVPFDWFKEVVQVIRKRTVQISGEHKFELPVVPFDWYISQPENLRRAIRTILPQEPLIEFDQEVVTMDKWFTPIVQPYFDRKRFYLTGGLIQHTPEVVPVGPYEFICDTNVTIFVKESENVVIIESNKQCNTNVYE